MSVADIPEWIHKPALKSSPLRTLQAKAPQPEDYTLDYRTVITSFPEVRQIEWSNFREHPYYTVKDGKGEKYIDATDSVPHTLQLQKKKFGKVWKVYMIPIAFRHINVRATHDTIEPF